jgi:hypothetical protein
LTSGTTKAAATKLDSLHQQEEKEQQQLIPETTTAGATKNIPDTAMAGAKKFILILQRQALVGCMIHWGLHWPRTLKKVVQYSFSHITKAEATKYQCMRPESMQQNKLVPKLTKAGPTKVSRTSGHV